MAMITIKTCYSEIDAHILKNMLEGEGIECILFDDNIVSINPLYSNAVGGIKLKIQEEDKDKAMNILVELAEKPFLNKNNEVISCPTCQSQKLYSNFNSMNDAKGVLAAITSVLLSAFPLYTKSVYRCKECEMEFDVK
jgi:hypothetical protein